MDEHAPPPALQPGHSVVLWSLRTMRHRHPALLALGVTLLGVAVVAGIATWGDFDERTLGAVLHPPASTTSIAGWGALVGLIVVSALQWVLARWPARRPLQTVLVLALALLFAAGLEIVLQMQLRDRVMTRPHPVLHHELIPSNPRFEINPQGCRGEAFPWRKPAGEFRILVVGDSSAFGWGVETAERFSDRLERMLKEKHPDWRVRVINAAVPGYCSLTAARQAQLSFFETEPDMIVVSVNNDAGLDDQAESAGTVAQASPLQIMLYRCVSFMALRKALLNYKNPGRPAAPTTKVPRVTEAEIRDSYHVLLSHTPGRSVVLSMPQRDASPTERVVWYKQLIENIARRENALFVDAYGAFRAQGRTGDAWFSDWVHPRAEGHRLIAEELLPVVEAEISRVRGSSHPSVIGPSPGSTSGPRDGGQ